MPGTGERCLDGTDIDDLALSTLDHVPCRGLTDIENGGNVRLQQPLEGIRRKILKRCAMLHAGIVHENIDRARAGLETVNGLPCRVVIGHVEGKLADLDTLRLQRFGSRCQLRAVTSVQDDFRTCLRHPAGECKTDPLGRTV